MTGSQITSKRIRTFYLLFAEGYKYTLARRRVKILGDNKQIMQ